jgi:histidine triad (HIT) family protein
MDCIFCKIVKGEIKARIIMESFKSIAFLDAFPLAQGHVLVIPKNHYGKMQDLTQEDNSDLFSLVHKLISKIDSISGSSLVAIHNGKDAGQEVQHVHVHLIPRSTSDGAGAVHSMFKNRPNLSDAEFDDVLKKLQSV